MDIGIDLVEIADFKKRISTKEVLASIFTERELLLHTRPESLAGVFAAKEAFFKAMGAKLHWLDVSIDKEPSGKPTLSSNVLDSSLRAGVSISHTDSYATAVVVIYES